MAVRKVSAALDICLHVRVEDLENENDRVGSDQLVGNVLELVDVIEPKVLEDEEDDASNSLDQDLPMTLPVGHPARCLQRCLGWCRRRIWIRKKME